MPEQTLKRALSLPLLTLYGLGTILGAGIYVLIGEVAAMAGLYTPVAFLVASLLAGFTAFSYAELSARFPRAAGEAVYVQEGLHRRYLTITIGLLVVLTGVVSAATIANGFVGYLQIFIDLPDWLVIILLVLTLGSIAAWGIAESVVVATLVTVVEIGGLLLILWVTKDGFWTLPERLPELVPSLDGNVWHGILLGAFLAFYAFIGFEDMVNVAEEVKRPTRNLPIAILLALGAATLLYFAVALAAVLALPLAELAGSRAPLAKMYQHSTGSPPTVITVISLFAVVNGALIQIIMASRVLYGMSRQRWLPAILARLHPVTRTPLVATTAVTGVVLGLALWLPLVTLARATSFITLGVFALVNLALWRIKRRDPKPLGIPTYPLWLPVSGFLISAAFLLLQVVSLLRS